ncbi:MAG: GtrA family protein [Methanoregula sp.]|nr:GtrA family protein [Methanoregula sp.]
MTDWSRVFGREHLPGFLFVGVVSSLIDIGLLYYLCEYWAIWYIPAAVVSYCSGIVVSYCLNKVLTFHDRNRDYLLQFTTFAVISVSCLMVNICIIWLAVELVSLNYLVAKVIATACAFFWNYYGQSRITFRGS